MLNDGEYSYWVLQKPKGIVYWIWLLKFVLFGDYDDIIYLFDIRVKKINKKGSITAKNVPITGM